MRKALLLFILITVPFSAFMVVNQVFVNEQIQREIGTLIEKQQSLFEKNKRMVANIAILRSPARIDELAKNDLNLKQITDDRIIHIKIIPGKEESGDGNSF